MLMVCALASGMSALAQQPTTRQPSTTQKPSSKTPVPTAAPTPLPTPLPSSTPFPVPSTTTPAATPQSSTPIIQTPSGAVPTQQSPLPSSTPTATPIAPSQTTGLSSSSAQPVQPLVNPLSRDEAIRLALGQASTFQQAGFNERIAAEEVRQARAAFLPRVETAPAYIYTSPARGLASGEPRIQSFIANNSIGEYQALINVTGELDISGRLRATLRRNVALLEAARAGTAVARRALIAGIDDAYYGLALATAKRRAAEQNLSAAEEFERITSLLLSGGEVAPVDLSRARLQTISRRDELEQARANEVIAADALRILVGYDFTTPIATTDLIIAVPDVGEIERFTSEAISKRPEIAQFEAERRAAEEDLNLARRGLRPQITYTLSGGFDTDSLRPPRLTEHTGYSASIGVSIPILDWGVNSSKVRQAQIRAQIAESSRVAAMRGFAQQFYDARTLAISAAARIRLASAGIAEAERNLAASLARYRAGEAQIIEVTDAQNTLITQRTAFYQAIFDYQTARARLMQATGQ